MRFFVLPGIIASVTFAAFAVAGAQAFAIDMSMPASEAPVGLGSSAFMTPSALEARTAEMISVAVRVAAEEMVAQSGRRVILESAAFSRSNGIVTGQGVFWDGQGPRGLKVFIDAYGAGDSPMASFPLDIQSTGQRQPVAFTIHDMPDFERFAFRFTADGEDLRLSSPNETALKTAAVAPTAMLFHSDYGELRSLMEDLGYGEAGSFEPVAMMGMVSRFRQDNGLSGPGFASLGDLFAARIVAGKDVGPTSVTPYLEWASSIAGMREILRRPVKAPYANAQSEPSSTEPTVSADEEAFFLD